jgi:hypothetical protein
MAQPQNQYPDPDISQIQDRAWIGHQESSQYDLVEGDFEGGDFAQDAGSGYVTPTLLGSDS